MYTLDVGVVLFCILLTFYVWRLLFAFGSRVMILTYHFWKWFTGRPVLKAMLFSVGSWLLVSPQMTQVNISSYVHVTGNLVNPLWSVLECVPYNSTIVFHHSVPCLYTPLIVASHYNQWITITYTNTLISEIFTGQCNWLLTEQVQIIMHTKLNKPRTHS